MMNFRMLSVVALVVALAFALAFAPTLEPTAPGMVMLLLAPALAFGAAGLREGRKGSGWFAGLLAVVSAYVLWRAWSSPVMDYGRSDAMLFACGAAACVWAGWLAGKRSLKGFAIGLAVLALANLAVALIQWRDPGFTPFFSGRKTTTFPSGFYGHYNHFANFMLAAGFVAAGHALFTGSRMKARFGWGLVTLACVVGIMLSQSRGALLAVASGSAVLLVAWLLDLKRRKSRHFGIALLGVVLVVPLLAFGGWKIAESILSTRVAEGGKLSDDSGRLEMAAMALEMAGNHPPSGGGSRSFSYELFEYWNPDELWTGSADADFVHNELLQTLADYGWVGLLLVVALLFGLLLRGVLVLAIEPEREGGGRSAALTAGALAGIAAMLTQSMFSFVFHMAPDVIVFGALAGIVIGRPWPFASMRSSFPGKPRLLQGVVLAFAIGLVIFGWRDAAAWWIAARPGASRQEASGIIRHEKVARALAVRPDFRLERRGAEDASEVARGASPEDAAVWKDTTIRHLRSLVARHPKEYSARLALAMQLDGTDGYQEAGALYRSLIPLLDTRESHYRTHFQYGSHAYRCGYALWQARRPAEGLAWGLEAKRQMERSRELFWFAPDSPQGIELQRVEQFIGWLQNARVTPAEGVVPES